MKTVARDVSEPVFRDIQYMKLLKFAETAGQFTELVVPQGQQIEATTVTNLINIQIMRHKGTKKNFFKSTAQWFLVSK